MPFLLLPRCLGTRKEVLRSTMASLSMPPKRQHSQGSKR